jgi:cysteine synthase B
MKNGKKGVLGAIGNTPLVQLVNLNGNPDVKIFAKLEGNNPGGSIKDRPAYYMIKMAEESGQLTADKIIIEPTSGNTGIAIAMIGAAKGYKVKLFMPECVSVERQLILQAFGAEAILTPAKEAVDGAIRRAHEALKAEPGKYYMPNQFDNPNNILSHYDGHDRHSDWHRQLFKRENSGYKNSGRRTYRRPYNTGPEKHEGKCCPRHI